MNSEVARLIQDSIEQDCRRAEAIRAREMLLKLQNQSREDEEDDERVSEAEEQQPAQQDMVCGYSSW